jgi:hypothetical protein
MAVIVGKTAKNHGLVTYFFSIVNFFQIEINFSAPHVVAQ